MTSINEAFSGPNGAKKNASVSGSLDYHFREEFGISNSHILRPVL